MPKTISFGLSVKEVQNAIKEVKEYQKSLDYKIDLLCDRLAEIGIKTIKENLPSTSTNVGCESEKIVHGQRINIYAEGKLILFFEFGSGIKYNSGNKHPKESEFGYGVGTYPDQTHAFDPNGWWYLGEDGEYHHSYGVKATMPMYKAGMEIRNQVRKIAKEVFRS